MGKGIVEQKYIFISYAHKDMEKIFPIIEELQRQNFCLWYDEVIDPGTEWDDNIAEHVENCTIMLSFISRSYLASENCKDELNYARDLGKKRLLIYIEDVKLPGGMSMRLGRQQAIYYHRYFDKGGFYAKLAIVPEVEECRLRDEPVNMVLKEEKPEAKISEGQIPEAKLSENKDILQEDITFVSAANKIFGRAIPPDSYSKIDAELKKEDMPEKVLGVCAINDLESEIFEGAKFIIPDGFTSISKNAIEEKKKKFRNIKTLLIPSSVHKVDIVLFKYMSGLQQIIVSEKNPYYFCINGVLMTKEPLSIVYAITPKNTVESYSFDTIEEPPEIPDKILTYSSARKIIVNSAQGRKLFVPEGITGIDTVLLSATDIEEIIFPSTLRCLSADHFKNIRNLKKIRISAQNPWYLCINNVVIKKNPPEILYAL